MEKSDQFSNMTKKIHSLKVVLSSHTLFNWGPEEMLSIYLQHCEEFLSIRHPFEEKRSKPSFYELCRFGKKIIKQEIRSINSELLSYIKDLMVTIQLVIQQHKKYDLFIGVDPLNALAGLLLKSLGKTRHVIFYVIDYQPIRFKNPILNFIYHFMERYCAKNADSVWFLTEGIREIFLSKGITKEKCILTPTQIEKIYAKQDQNLDNPIIGYIGALWPEKGIELIIDSIPTVAKLIPNIRVVIIGGGPLEKDLHQRVKDLNIENYVTFTGHMDSRSDAMEILSKCSIGIAPYVVKEKYYTSFGYGAKVFDYMACGLPVIITHWKEIEEKELGLTIDYDAERLSSAILCLLTDRLRYERCKQNVLQIAKERFYKNVFDNAFSIMNL